LPLRVGGGDRDNRKRFGAPKKKKEKRTKGKGRSDQEEQNSQEEKGQGQKEKTRRVVVTFGVIRGGWESSNIPCTKKMTSRIPDRSCSNQGGWSFTHDPVRGQRENRKQRGAMIQRWGRGQKRGPIKTHGKRGNRKK